MIGLWILGLSAVLAAPLSADEAVRQALARSEVVARAEAEVMAAVGRRKASSLLMEEPTVTGSWAALGEMWSVQLIQPVSLSGEGLAAQRQARSQVAAAQARQRRVRLETAAEVRRVWADAVAARARRTLARQALDQAVVSAEATDQALQAGEGTGLARSLARLRQGAVRATWVAAVSDEARAAARLATLTGADPDTLELPADPALASPALQGAATVRSDVEAAEATLRAAVAGVRRARAAVLPRVGLGLFVEEEGPEFRVGPRVRLTLPVWSRQADGRAAALGAQATAEAARTQRHQQAAAERATAAWAAGQLDAAPPTVDVPAEAARALEQVAAGVEAGALDALQAGRLRSEILSAHQAWIRGRRAVAEVRIDAALAGEDEGLVGR